MAVCSVGGGQMLREASSWALSSMNFPDTHEKPLILSLGFLEKKKTNWLLFSVDEGNKFSS